MRGYISILALTAGAAVGADEHIRKFGWFAEMAGACWEGAFPDGKTRHSHCYSTQFGRFIRGTASLSGEHNGTMREQFAGDSVYSWDETAKRIRYTIWGSDGSLSAHEAFYEGDKLAFPVHSRKEPGKVAFRSLWRRVDANSFTVQRQVPDGEGWKTTLTVTYRKAAP